LQSGDAFDFTFWIFAFSRGFISTQIYRILKTYIDA
jgi:hypothetical protein